MSSSARVATSSSSPSRAGVVWRLTSVDGEPAWPPSRAGRSGRCAARCGPPARTTPRTRCPAPTACVGSTRPRRSGRSRAPACGEPPRRGRRFDRACGGASWSTIAGRGRPSRTRRGCAWCAGRACRASRPGGSGRGRRARARTSSRCAPATWMPANAAVPAADVQQELLGAYAVEVLPTRRPSRASGHAAGRRPPCDGSTRCRGSPIGSDERPHARQWRSSPSSRSASRSPRPRGRTRGRDPSGEPGGGPGHDRPRRHWSGLRRPLHRYSSCRCVRCRAEVRSNARRAAGSRRRVRHHQRAAGAALDV
jgi:hypothetical protein